MKSSIESIPLEKQFVQVELEQDNTVIDIHKHLDQFYISGNSILSKAFLKWYLKSWYNIKLSNDYTLKVFDKDVNFFSMGEESYVFLDSKKYSVIDKTKSEDTDDVNYEGATQE